MEIKLSLTIDELDAFPVCDGYEEVRDRLRQVNSDPCYEFTAADARAADCRLRDVLWVAARLAQKDRRIRDRLTGFVNDCLIKVLPIFEDRWRLDARPRQAILATEAFLAGAMSELEWIVLASEGQQAWASWAAPEAWVANGFWAAVGSRNSWSGWDNLGSGWDDWSAWSRWATWSLEAARKCQAHDTDGEERVAAESLALAWQFERFVAWLSPEVPDSQPISEDRQVPTPSIHFDMPVKIDQIEMAWPDLVIVPRSATQIEIINLERNAFLELPPSVRHIDVLSLEDHPTIVLHEGIVSIGYINLDYGSALALPATIQYIGHVRSYSYGKIDGTSPPVIGKIEARGGVVTVCEGLTRVEEVIVVDCELTLPSTLNCIGRIQIANSESTIHLSEGIVAVGDILLHQGAELTIPDSVEFCGKIEVESGAILILPANELVPSRLEVAPGGEVNRRTSGPSST